MSNKFAIILGAIVIVIIIVAAAYYLSGNEAAKLAQNSATTTADNSGGVGAPPYGTTPPPAATGTTPGTGAVTISMTDSGFVPASVTVSAGQTVTFVNNGTQPIWPASNPHPIHTGYPTSGGCIGSTFDACQGIAPGGSWSFTFTKTGTWGYHDHLNPRLQGVVVVR